MTAAAALAVHCAVLGTVQALGLSLTGHVPAGRALVKPPANDDVELSATCSGNAVFSTSGRTAMCFAPWVADVDRCLADAQLNLWIELSSCQARNDPSTAVAMVDRIPTERLKQIDPERLLDEAKPEPKPTPPPPPELQQPQPAAAPPPPPPPPPPAPQLPQQVVETVKPTEDKEPDNARFLSEFNTRVEKQKVSRGARNEPMVAKAKPEELTAKAKPQDEPQAKPQPPDRLPGKADQAPDVPGHLSMRSPGVKSPADADQEATQRGSMLGAAGQIADGLAARKGDGAIDQERKERSEVARGEAGAGGGVPRVPNLKASNEVLERALGGGSVDRLEDVENGDETSLNSKRWVYAAFFNRVKRQVAQNWEPVSVWRRRDPTGTVFGFKTRVTEVKVSLSPRGDVAKVLVTAPSGVVELDDEAVRAFRAAGPFPNPPDGLVQNNLITFQFGFAFEIGTSSHLSWRMPTAM